MKERITARSIREKQTGRHWDLPIDRPRAELEAIAAALDIGIYQHGYCTSNGRFLTDLPQVENIAMAAGQLGKVNFK